MRKRARVTVALVSASWAVAFSPYAHAICNDMYPCPLPQVCSYARVCVDPPVMELSQAQREQLALYGAMFDDRDRQTAARLTWRGFRAEDFVVAYRDYQTMSKLYGSSPLKRDVVEMLAVAEALGLNEKQKYELVLAIVDGGIPLTDAYNRMTVGNVTRPVIAGVVLIVIGAFAAAAGGVGLANRAEGEGGDTDRALGGLFLAGGGLMLMAGSISLGVGISRGRDDLPEYTLETAPAATIRAIPNRILGVEKLPQSRPVRFLPMIGMHGGGLGISATF